MVTILCASTMQLEVGHMAETWANKLFSQKERHVAIAQVITRLVQIVCAVMALVLPLPSLRPLRQLPPVAPLPQLPQLPPLSPLPPLPPLPAPVTVPLSKVRRRGRVAAAQPPPLQLPVPRRRRKAAVSWKLDWRGPSLLQTWITRRNMVLPSLDHMDFWQAKSEGHNKTKSMLVL